MIPLRDNVGASRLAPANLFLIAATVAIFGYELRIGAAADPLMFKLGMVPAQISSLSVASASLWPPVTLLTSLFLHGGYLHIASNMLYLYIFGAAVERSFGHMRFVWFYLVAGVASGLAMVWMEPQSRIPVVGASGAIAGVLGAYFVLYPRARILTVLPLFIFVELIEIPAVAYLLVWFGIQVIAGLSSSGGQSSMLGGVAWWAHVGGFLFGMAAAPLLARSAKSSSARRVWA